MNQALNHLITFFYSATRHFREGSAIICSEGTHTCNFFIISEVPVKDDEATSCSGSVETVLTGGGATMTKLRSGLPFWKFTHRSSLPDRGSSLPGP